MEIFLTEHAGNCEFGSLVHFYAPDVDTYYLRLKELDVKISHPPGNTLGPDLRDMLVVDLDGNRLSFFTLAGDRGWRL